MVFLKKNQVLVAVIGLMLITAGYLNFSNTEDKNKMLETSALADSEQMAAIGDATLVSTSPVESNIVNTNEVATEEKSSIKNTNNSVENNSISQTNNIIETNTTISTDEYFTKSRLDRDTMYSQMIESYQKILEKTTVSEKQKASAQKEITKINEQKNAIMITENLIKTKGFEDLIILINDKSINIIVKVEELKQEEIAQIQNIATRELKTEINNIHISNRK